MAAIGSGKRAAESIHAHLTGVAIDHASLRACTVCEGPFVTASQYEAMHERLDSEASDQHLYPSCLSMKAGEAILNLPW